MEEIVSVKQIKEIKFRDKFNIAWVHYLFWNSPIFKTIFKMGIPTVIETTDNPFTNSQR